MGLRPDADGYGTVTKLLHWASVVAIAAQFVVGYAIDRADGLLDGVVDRWFGGEEEGLLVVHVALGLTIVVLAVVRLMWRRWAGLPAWAEGLSPTERRVAHVNERTLYVLMLLIPITGLALVLVSGEDWNLASGEWEAPLDLVDDDALLGSHILTHAVFFLALAIHVAMVLKHQIVDRDRLLNRML